MKQKSPALFIDLEMVVAIGHYIADNTINIREFVDWSRFYDILGYVNDSFVWCLVYNNRAGYPSGLVDDVISDASKQLLSFTGKQEMFYAFNINSDYSPMFSEYRVITNVINIALEHDVYLDLGHSIVFVKNECYYEACKNININTIITHENCSELFETSMGVHADDGVGGNI